jgi:excisionase family DNA binding protein
VTDNHDDERLLTPREAAEKFGVRVTTIARWAREGRLNPVRTPGGHRRYALSDLRRYLDRQPSEQSLVSAGRTEQDAVRLYAQGWSIRQIAQRFDMSYGATRRIILRHRPLRDRSGSEVIPRPGPAQRRSAPGAPDHGS